MSPYSFFNDTATTDIYTLSLHDALPILIMFQTFISRHNSNFFSDKLVLTSVTPASQKKSLNRSEERFSRNAETDLVCRLLLEKKKSDALQPLCAAADDQLALRTGQPHK